eukprot:CAMPEP_0180203070 /NCGR_PEP_ID=MMETSP0987-20121128/7651_1 /TAXON_ID=697907 /ORGANISM="non described non described, Strain CCMP2293" /LENGTH=81 /DNA_ID=CAMNT_0022158407 /DNA_START=504 /DNA_END=746 /DNA_ORIENTATION=+
MAPMAWDGPASDLRQGLGPARLGRALGATLTLTLSPPRQHYTLVTSTPQAFPEGGLFHETTQGFPEAGLQGYLAHKRLPPP